MSGIMMPLFGSIAAQSSKVAPSQISNLNLWYDASVATATTFNPVPANGGAVSAWLDKQATGRDANQNTGTRQPIWRSNQQNSLGTIQFDGSNDVLTLNPVSWALSLPGQTTYIVVKPTTLSGIPRIIQTNTGGFQFFWDTYWGIETASGRAKSANTGNTTNYIYMGMIFDGSHTDANTTTQNNLRLQFRINGVKQTLTFSSNVGTATSASANTLYVGADASPAANPFAGYIGELLLWNRTLSTTEITNVESYLSTKWGIT